MKSKIKWFNNEKGYGFIENTDGEDIFVHYSEINMDGYKTLKEGNYVKFDLKHPSIYNNVCDKFITFFRVTCITACNLSH